MQTETCLDEILEQQTTGKPNPPSHHEWDSRVGCKMGTRHNCIYEFVDPKCPTSLKHELKRTHLAAEPEAPHPHGQSKEGAYSGERVPAATPA